MNQNIICSHDVLKAISYPVAFSNNRFEYIDSSYKLSFAHKDLVEGKAAFL